MSWTWIYWITRSEYQFFSSLMTHIFQDDNIRIYQIIRKSGSGSIKHHNHMWIGQHRVENWTPLKIFNTWWRLYTVIWLSIITLRSWKKLMEINVIFIVTLHKHCINITITNALCYSKLEVVWWNYLIFWPGWYKAWAYLQLKR